MPAIFRLLLFIMMAAAFIFGFMDQYVNMNFERLHIFLFNLTSGGFTILYVTGKRQVPGLKACVFFGLSILYAVLAFLEMYIPAAAAAVILAVIVESVRQEKFSFFPAIFFNTKQSTSEKFHDASLLCLVLALLLSAFVIVNDSWLRLFHFDKLTLDVFFLGFSFPVSLITMSIIFGILEKNIPVNVVMFGHLAFWSVCAGVIVFFLFIIAESFPGEVFISTFLFVTVLLIFLVFFRYGRRIQQKYFLVSAIYFLLFTAITGILYILIKNTGSYELQGRIILRMHAFYSLYGWNLTGMMVIIRWEDFPIALNTRKAIFFHWGVILILAPLAKFVPVLTLPAIASYIIFLSIFFFSKNKIRTSS
ncbi:MAG TPA: hypothetical protein PK514_11270 [Spirochaetota bacterium]|nr:hypothetical protein [Spirochaetota bacterium]